MLQLIYIDLLGLIWKNKHPYLCEAIILLTRWAIPALMKPEGYFGVLIAKPTVYINRKIGPENKNLTCNVHSLVQNSSEKCCIIQGGVKDIRAVWIGNS